MAESMVIRNEILINAAAIHVWDALVNPEKTKVYMFGCEPKTDWSPGSTIKWEAMVDGSKLVFVTGKVVRYGAPRILQYTVFDPNKNMQDIPENHLKVTFTLEEENGQTKLSVTQDGFEGAEDGKARYDEVNNNGLGWMPILQQIATLVEQDMR